MGFFGSLFEGRKLGEQLIEASKSGDTEEVKSLLAKGADVNARKKNGVTALMLASESGYPQVVELLKRRGAS